MRSGKDRTLPLSTYIARRKGEIAKNAWIDREVQTLPGPVEFELWIPGRPCSKGQGWPAQSPKTGRLYIAHDEKGLEYEQKIRQLFIDSFRERYPWLVPHLPLMDGGAYIQVWAWYERPVNWYPGLLPTQSGHSDDENIGKVVKDAVGGRQKGAQGLVYWDDILCCRTTVEKAFWDPDRAAESYWYPQGPGVLANFRLVPAVRDPSLLPPGEFVCPHCGRDDWKSYRGGRQHARWCATMSQ